MNVPWNKGIPRTQKEKDNISKGLKGRIPWNKGILMPEEIRQKMRKPHKKTKHKDNKEPEILKFISENQGKHFCQCPCHGIIIIKRHHYWYGIPKYINYHGRYGTKHTEESKLKNSQSNRKPRPNKQGNNHWNWQGGKSFEPYCEKFNNITKEGIRERDNYQCQNPNCLCTQIESMILYSGTLHVHHIHYDKPNCDPDLITLCQSCNCKANYNRDYWEKLYMMILKNRGLCK